MSTAAIAPLTFTPEQRVKIKQEFCKGATDAQADLFIDECERRRLIPGTHLHFQVRNAKEWDPELRTKVTVKKTTMVTRIDALRLIANRTGGYQGQAEAEYIYLDEKNAPSVISTIPLPHATNTQLPREPWAVKQAVYRDGFKTPMVAIARFDAYAVTYKSGDATLLTEMWSRRGPEQLAKCAEALALRKAFPEELGGIYLNEELDRDNNLEPEPSAAAVAPDPVALDVPTVNSAPVAASTEQRPTEEAKPKRTRATKVEPNPTQASATTTGTTVEASTSQESKPVAEEILPAELPHREPLAPLTDDAQAAADDIFGAAPEKPVDDLDRPCTQEEIAEVGVSIRKLNVDRAALQKFIIRDSGAADTKSLTKRMWEAVLTKLMAANAKGPEALQKLIF